MKIDQFSIDNNRFTFSKREIVEPEEASFILLFTSRTHLEKPDWLAAIHETYAGVPVVSCSTSGEIYEADILDDSVSAIAVQLEKTPTRIVLAHLQDFKNSFEAGKYLAEKLNQPDLKHVFITSDGWLVNGTDLLDGMYSVLQDQVTISGGMAGDGANFAQTLVGLNDDIQSGNIAAIGFYGDKIKFGFGSHGGWDEYGLNMKVTRATGRVIYELDGKPALDLYKLHLGDDANGLPGTALLYPVAVTLGDHRDAVVRTVHYVDELNKSIVLGGDVSEGSSMRFMRAEFDDLMKGVEEAAVQTSEMIQSPIELAIVVSCIGRKLLFGQTIQKEIDLTKDHIGNQAVLVGFYSYGEICPVKKEFAQLNHQMLTITAISEILH